MSELEWDDELMTSCIDAIGWLIKLHGANFLPVLQVSLMELTGGLLQHNQPQFRTAGICIVDDVIEHCGAETQPLIPTFLPFLMQALEDDEPSIRQCAAYGVGVLAEHGGDAFTQSVPDALQLLGAMVSTEGAREEDNAGATDNAVKAIMLLCKFRAGTPAFDVNEVLVQVSVEREGESGRREDREREERV